MDQNFPQQSSSSGDVIMINKNTLMNGILVFVSIVLIYWMLHSDSCRAHFKSMFQNKVDTVKFTEALNNAYGNNEMIAMPKLDVNEKKDKYCKQFEETSNNKNVNYASEISMHEYNPAEGIKDENIDKSHQEWAKELSKTTNMKSSMMAAEFEEQMYNYNPWRTYQQPNHGILLDRDAGGDNKLK